MIHDIKEMLDMLPTNGGHIVVCVFMILLGTILAVYGLNDISKEIVPAFIGALLLGMKSTGKANGVTESTTKIDTVIKSGTPGEGEKPVVSPL